MVENQDVLASVHGPAALNDPDMLVIGNENITVEMAKTQLTVWCIWSAPLLISTDLRKIDQKFKEILLNREAIAINQDSMVKFGKVVKKEKDILYFVKEINPVIEGKMSYAIAVVNMNENVTHKYIMKISKLGLYNEHGYVVTNIWKNHRKSEIIKPRNYIAGRLLPAGSLFIKLIAIGSTTSDSDKTSQSANSNNSYNGLLDAMLRFNPLNLFDRNHYLDEK
ncbi:hypothetical protein WR25_06994 [Diploscapter pachys]|uniref:Alpha-galactosidase n=1 Tax=Diploscapter pachys TaxID=2018661 RepID=A0A2A2LWN3_9BILA|nr:hypothetical protein WR25_06994 [Diploscapter pachys]